MNPHIVPASQHTLFMRGFHPNTEMNRIRDFFTKEGGKCSFDFFKVSQDATRLFVALRFESRDVAKDILSRFDNSTVLGSKIAITWFKDLRRARLKALQHGQQWNYRYNSRNGYHRNFNKYGSYRMKSTVWQRRSSKDYEARRGSSSSRSRSRSRSRSHYSRSRSRSYSRTRSRSRSRSHSSSPSRSRSHSRNRSASPRPHRQRSHSSTSSRGSSHEQPGAKYWKDNEPPPPGENDKPKENESVNQTEAREEGEVNSETQGDGMEGGGSANEKGEVEKRTKRSRSSSLEFMRKTERSSSRSSSPSDPSDPKERRKKKKKHRRSKHHRHHRRHGRRRHRSSSDEGQKSDFDAEQLERMCRMSGSSQEPSNPISVHHMDGMDDEELELLMNLPSKEDSPKSPRMADAVSRESDGMSPLHVSEGDDEQPNEAVLKLGMESQAQVNSVEKEQKNDVINNLPSTPAEPEEKERDVPTTTDNNTINTNSDTNAVSDDKASPKIGKATSVKINPSSKSLLEKYKSSLKHQVPTPTASFKKLSFKQKKADDELEKNKSIFPTKEMNNNPERSTILSDHQISRIKMKKAEMEETFRQDTETFATVVKMLISKDPSLEEKVQYSLKENLRDIARRCINELQEYIDTINDS